MDVKEIETRLDAIVKVASDKGWKDPNCYAQIESGGRHFGYFRAKHPTLCDIKYNIADGGHSDTIEGVLSQLESIAEKTEDVSVSEKQFWMKSLADVIDSGNKIGMDVEFMNPLTETMRALSENIITKDAE